MDSTHASGRHTTRTILTKLKTKENNCSLPCLYSKKFPKFMPLLLLSAMSLHKKISQKKSRKISKTSWKFVSLRLIKIVLEKVFLKDFWGENVS